MKFWAFTLLTRNKLAYHNSIGAGKRTRHVHSETKGSLLHIAVAGGRLPSGSYPGVRSPAALRAMQWGQRMPAQGGG